MNEDRQARPAHTPRIALTGGIASGKTTVAKLFEALGARLIDTDRISREIVAPPSLVLDRIAARFGADVLLPGGGLDRPKLRQLVFADATARRDLESIIHPAIHDELTRQCAAAKGPYLIVAVPLLVETGTRGFYDRVLVVDASRETQRRRLMARDGMDADTADRMIAAQASREARLEVADDVIENDGDVRRLAAQVEALHRRYLELRSPAGDMR